jgi:hypothetical protein
MSQRIWKDQETGMWHFDVQGHGLRAAGVRSTRQAALAEALDGFWKFCAGIGELAEAGTLPLAVRRESVTVRSA